MEKINCPTLKMVLKEEEEELQPVSPTGQYLSSSVLSLHVIGVLELEVPIICNMPAAISLLNQFFLPINPRFSSVMVVDKNGDKQWKKVEVKLENHVNFPVLPSGMSPEAYDKYLDEYISKIGMEQLPQSQPLWEIHVIKYPTSHAAGTLIFKLHHSLGDGFSLMGALLSCLQRADNPTIPLTFPSGRFPLDNINHDNNKSINIFRSVSKLFSVVSGTVSDFCWSVVKSTLVEDDLSPIRSGNAGVEFRPLTVATMTFSLDDVKKIKAKVGATINDVVTGVIFLGTRLYMQEMREAASKAHTTALVLLNTRVFRSYVSVKDMVRPDAKAPWGNYFAFLHVSIPDLTDTAFTNPLEFVFKAQQIINRKKNSLAVFLTGKLLEIIKKFRGPEAVSGYVHRTLKNSSMAITNMVGPVEKMALDNHPIKGLYFIVAGSPQSLSLTIVSYMRKLRVTVVAEDGFIDSQKLKSCIENAFEMMLNATSGTLSTKNS